MNSGFHRRQRRDGTGASVSGEYGVDPLSLYSTPVGNSGYAALANTLRCNFVLTEWRRNIYTPFESQISTYLARNVQCRASTLQCPIVIVNPMRVPRNSAIALSPAQLQITTPSRTPLNGNFIVSAIRNGQFINPQAQVLNQFSQLEVNNSQVLLQADNSGLPIMFNIIVTASFCDLTTCAIPLVFNITDGTTTTTSTSTRAPTTTTTSTFTFAPTTSTPTFAPTTPTSTPAVMNCTAGSASSSSSPALLAGVAAAGGMIVGGAAMYFLPNRRRRDRLPHPLAAAHPMPRPFMLANPLMQIHPNIR